MKRMDRRGWVPDGAETYIQSIAAQVAANDARANEELLLQWVADNHQIHERDCINLNPATNMMNPKAEALLGSGIGSRPSLGYPGDKYEMGLEAIEKIEVMAAELACEVFGAKHAEIRVASGAMANLYVFMACAKPGDVIIAPPGDIGGHVTHHADGCAGLYGLVTHAAAVNAKDYTVDVDALRADAHRLKPKLITIGGSLNLFPHPIADIRAIADEVGAIVMFDAAHMSGMIAGKAWQQPLSEGAHVMTMSTYKSLGGPPAGLILTNDAEIAQRLDAIAYPGMTANFDAAKSAALAMALLDWKEFGTAYGKAMAATARALAAELMARGIKIHAGERGGTTSHQFAIEVAGQTSAKLLRQANILSCGIGLPMAAVQGDLNGLRMGTPEIVRWGMRESDMPQVAQFIADVLSGRRYPQSVAAEVAAFRSQFGKLHFVRS